MGVSECQADLFRGTGFVGDRVEPGSVFALLFGEGGPVVSRFDVR